VIFLFGTKSFDFVTKIYVSVAFPLLYLVTCFTVDCTFEESLLFFSVDPTNPLTDFFF
jgi:hypothetical protein